MSSPKPFPSGDLVSLNYPDGKDLIPLPHESSVSCMLRVSWHNELQGSLLHRLFSGRTGGYLENPLYFGWISRSVVAANLGWVLPTDVEILIHKQFRFCANLLFSERLRICPICMECGYHSYWHQLLALEVCPVHGCEIASVCQSCGGLLPNYGFNGELFDHPYICRTCHFPYSGAPLQNFPGEDFDEHRSQLKVAFSDLEAWFRRYTPLSIADVVSYPYGPKHFRFGLRRLRTELLLRANPPSFSVWLLGNPHVEILPWTIHMVQRWSTKSMTRREPDFRSLTSVLKIVLRRLGYFVFGDFDSPLQRDIHKALRFSQPFQIFSSELSAVQHAYVEFCNRFVTGLGYDSCSWHRHICLSSLPELDLPLWEGRLPRLVLRNILFAMFAAYFHEWVRKLSGSQGTMSIWQYKDRDLIGFVCSQNVHGATTGYVAFPKVVGLPCHRLPPWRSTTMVTGN